MGELTGEDDFPITPAMRAYIAAFERSLRAGDENTEAHETRREALCEMLSEAVGRNRATELA